MTFFNPTFLTRDNPFTPLKFCSLALIIFMTVLTIQAQSREDLLYSSFQYDEIERTFYLHLPNGFNELESLPVVMVLHGGGKGDGDDIATHFGFNEIADIEGFIAVYPNGVESQWNDGRGKTFRRNEGNEDIDDVGFLSALIDSLIQNYKADPKRIYVTGVSNGGMMTFRLGCEITSTLAAITPVIANMPVNIANDCKPDSPLPVLIMNGTKDPLVPWEGGQVKFLGRKMGEVLSTENSVRFWVEHNKCFEEPVTVSLPDFDDEDESIVRVVTYKSNESDTEVVLYAVIGGGHNIPGSKTPDVRLLLGNKNNDINAAEVIWNFLKKHKRN